MIDPDRKHAMRDGNYVTGEPGTCCLCGCTEDRACLDDDGLPCSWVPGTGERLCTACEDTEDARILFGVPGGLPLRILDADDPHAAGRLVGALVGLGLVLLGIAGLAAMGWLGG